MEGRDPFEVITGRTAFIDSLLAEVFPATKNQINCLQRWIDFGLKEWRNTQWSDALESLNPDDQSLWKITEWVMRILDHNPLLPVPGGLICSDSKKA